jgi:TonB family protein
VVKKNFEQVQPAQVVIKTAEPGLVPPVVTFEPHPQYTEEAARARVQGEVTLRVRFLSTGRVVVLQVVSGLGHGLDESAIRTAQGLRLALRSRTVLLVAAGISLTS